MRNPRHVQFFFGFLAKSLQSSIPHSVKVERDAGIDFRIRTGWHDVTFRDDGTLNLIVFSVTGDRS